MRKRLYVAYGSNLNFQQMKYRCPTAKLYGTGTINNYELQFKGQPGRAFATIAPKEGASVPAAVWEIQPKDERSLDIYEGYPGHYFKQNVSVQLGGEEVSAMVYVMNLKMQFALPSVHYYQTVHEGYKDCGLDTDILDQAVGTSAARIYSSVAEAIEQQGLFDYGEYEEEGVEEVEDEMDETDPFFVM